MQRTLPSLCAGPHRYQPTCGFAVVQHLLHAHLTPAWDQYLRFLPTSNAPHPPPPLLPGRGSGSRGTVAGGLPDGAGRVGHASPTFISTCILHTPAPLYHVAFRNGKPLHIYPHPTRRHYLTDVLSSICRLFTMRTPAVTSLPLHSLPAPHHLLYHTDCLPTFPGRRITHHHLPQP